MTARIRATVLDVLENGHARNRDPVRGLRGPVQVPRGLLRIQIGKGTAMTVEGTILNRKKTTLGVETAVAEEATVVEVEEIPEEETTMTDDESNADSIFNDFGTVTLMYMKCLMDWLAFRIDRKSVV